jgi:nanoRNase/pAp phosphatase (c-di-AMP/oligoRNAs hydrolase)
MTNIDVFNGDADGICALVQLRLAEPQHNQLVTGIKRDINLLQSVTASAGDNITVLDISMQKNRADLERLLAAGANVFYADHHNAGAPLEYENLDAHIDLSPTVCTSLIIDQLLKGRFHLWSLTAAYGDNLTGVAEELALTAGLSSDERAMLKKLGVYLNYNGYGASLDDLFFHPAELYRQCVVFDSPLKFIVENPEVYQTLEAGYHEDLAKAQAVQPLAQHDKLTAYCLPDEKWARRVSGVFGNQLSNDEPQRAHLVLTEKAAGTYQVSIRAPQNNLVGADEVASQFETGGGRKGAAGINALPAEQLPDLIALMQQRYA